jgi:hypothetical protein
MPLADDGVLTMSGLTSVGTGVPCVAPVLDIGLNAGEFGLT